MKLLIKQRLFTLLDNYYVYDETGEVRYQVEQAFLALGHQFHVYDCRADERSEEVGYIRQKLFALMPTFEIVVRGQVVGTVRKEFTLFRPRYYVDYRNWEVEGDLMGWDYRVSSAGRNVLSISKELFNWTDTYAMTYQNPADEIPGLLLVIAIDAVNCSHND